MVLMPRLLLVGVDVVVDSDSARDSGAAVFAIAKGHATFAKWLKQHKTGPDKIGTGRSGV